ncbi:ATP-dependent DNA helicase PIF1 [Holothuria leucospilota]|uniref:ATP-dependent DNA helicase PIF1 n=1 Tax=Holothuria leucospilota TaxID=206669 RepID=A0A9Q1C8Q9_HOLLE|nr:ATP-dependent DNA helicase PIF1 [Holothuria leucospilota]
MLELRVVKDIPDNVPFIAAKKAVVDAHNIKMLHSLQSRVEFIEAVDIIGTANATLKKLLKPTPNAKSTLPAELNIAIGARVMLTTNLDVADGLVNGVTGKVTGIVHGNLPNNQPEAICILFDNPRIGANCRRKYLPPANVAQGSVVILPHKEIYQIRLQHVTRQQFPLKLAWAFTIHKVQGMTMERATVSFTGIFQAGMAYVALSRVVTLGGLYLTDFDSNLIYCNAEDELPRQVHVRGERVPVRTILLEDREAKVKVALWRNESGAQIQAGDFVSIQNVMDISEEIIAYIEDENDMIHLLLASNEMLSTNIELLKTTFNIEDDNWQPVLEAFIPFKANMTVKEGEITRINIQSVANMDNP